MKKAIAPWELNAKQGKAFGHQYFWLAIRFTARMLCPYSFRQVKSHRRGEFIVFNPSELNCETFWESFKRDESPRDGHVQTTL